MHALNLEDLLILNDTFYLPESGLICAHPGRVQKMGELYLENSQLVVDYRGFQVYTGQFQGKPLFLANTGIGAPAAAFILQELIRKGAKRIIRVGSNDFKEQDQGLNIVTKAQTPLSIAKDYGEENPPDFISASPYLLEVLRLNSLEGRANLTVNHHVDGYYGVNFYSPKEKFKGQVSRDMETGALFYLGQKFSLEFSSILISYPKHGKGLGEKGQEEVVHKLEVEAFSLALRALRS